MPRSTVTVAAEMNRLLITSAVSRLTYADMQTNSGELFGRVDSPWRVFVKGFIGTDKPIVARVVCVFAAVASWIGVVVTIAALAGFLDT